VLKRFWPFIRPYVWAIALGTAFVILAEGLRKVQPLITRYLVDSVLTPVIRGPWSPPLYDRSLRLLGYALAYMLATSAAGALISRFRMYIMQRAGAAMVLDLRLYLYNHLQKLSLNYYESRQTGEIMSRVTGDVDAMENLITHVSDHLLTDVLSIVITLIILFSLSWQLALVCLIPVPLLLALMWRFSKVIRPIYRKIRDRMGEITAKLQDNLAGIRVIKAFHTEADEAARFERENREYFAMQMKGVRLWTGAFPLIRFVQGTGGIMVTAVGGYMLLQPHPQITLGDLFAFTAYVGQLYEPISSLFRTYDVVLRSAASGERVIEVMDEQPEIADGPNAEELPPTKGHVRFENVSFKYQTGEQVLRNVTLEAQPGEVVALVGRSGAGKTSIINLIPRFYDPIEGRVTIDGHDVQQVTQQSLRSQIAIVLQDAFLFSGTVRENIRYGKPDATDDEIVAAARAAYAEEFIEKLPDGYETELGERGFKLSGGQKQRLSIARALLADRRILILDEATSMMDSEAEYYIQKALEKLMEGRTCFVIAHRLSTVRNADKIAALEGGQIVEVGDHATLLEKNGTYAQMYQVQFRLALEGEAADNADQARGRAPEVEEPSLGDDTGGGGIV
jgi:subfamily B ATP-binding cassette protein MsbA